MLQLSNENDKIWKKQMLLFNCKHNSQLRISNEVSKSIKFFTYGSYIQVKPSSNVQYTHFCFFATILIFQ